ncbi:Dyp-type peroxidase [Cellulomonas sp. P5_C6]
MRDRDASATSQPVLTPLTSSAIFLVLAIDAGGEPQVRDLLTDVTGLQRSVGFRDPAGGLAVVVGIGSSAWDRLFPQLPRPLGLHEFREVAGETHTAPATPGDLMFHIRATRLDLCFELASHLVERLRGAARVLDEVHGFKFFDERDLMGFVDGTENPTGGEALEAVTVGDEDPFYAGSSYVVVQKYLHDLDTWNALPVEVQEHVIGRTKLADIELPDDVKPSNSHVALTVITDDDGTERKIVRDNMPFGRVGEGEFGTYFIGYADHPDPIEQMLSNMFVGKPPGNHDRILDFSTAVTGNLFFVPTVDLLDDPPDEPVADAPDTPESSDSSLGIGSLRRSTAP